MTVLSRETVRDEIVSGLTTALTGTGKPVNSVYRYMPSKLNKESPVVLVLSKGIQRTVDGVGAKKYRSDMLLELHTLVYDGPDNPLTDQQREDRMDAIEQAIATWFAVNQEGTSYQNVYYTPQPSELGPTKYIDGNPYLLEILTVQVEAKDT